MSGLCRLPMLDARTPGSGWRGFVPGMGRLIGESDQSGRILVGFEGDFRSSPWEDRVDIFGLRDGFGNNTLCPTIVQYAIMD